MKTANLLKSLCFITLATLMSCMDNSVYDPESKKDNGNVTDLVVPSNFTWSTTTKVAVNVNTGNKNDYTYTILIYPQGATEEALPLTVGFAKKGAPFNGEITVPACDTIVSVVKTMKYNSGSTLRLQCSAPIKNGKVTVDFENTGAPITRSLVTTRAKDQNDDSNIAEDLKEWAAMTELTDATTNLKVDGLYKVSEGKTVTLAELELGKDVRIYVAGVLKLSPNITINNSNGDNKIIILGKNEKSEKGGELYSDGSITVKNGLKIENHGSINVKETLIIRDDSEVETKGCINAKHIEIAAQGQGATLDIEEGGYVYTESMYIEKSEIELDENAYLFILGNLECKNNNTIDGETTKSSIVEVGSISKVQGHTNKELTVERAFIVCEKSTPDFVELNNNQALWGDRNAAANHGAKTEGSDCANFTPKEDNTGEDTTPEEIITSPGISTYAFEDNWPLLGDYDMNDLVLETNPAIYSLDKAITKVVLKCKLTAIGANKKIAAAVQWDNVSHQAISSIEYNTTNNFSEDLFERNANGTEKEQSFAVIPLFDNAHAFANVKEGKVAGTQPNSKFTVKEFTVTINLNSKAATLSNAAIEKLNFFITCDASKGKRMEIHLVDGLPTSLFDKATIGKEVASENTPFKAKGNFCWAMRIPNSFRFPLESNNIRASYENFDNWITDPNYAWYEHPISGKVK